jgi:NADH-quinone oxidoreductase subunit L
MVKAGVYLVARMSPIFYLGTWEMHLPEAQVFFIVIACVGAFTCFMAASQALVSVELKKILAYSTVSQIGYMMLALGVSGMSEGAYVAGLTASVFHLTSHALFKAALFLGAGSVIHAIHTIYTFNMGGMKKYMPITFILMVIATASLAGIPPLSGFWSKDAVFIACLVANTPLSLTLLAVGAVSAAMTFFYSIRYIKLTFLGHESKHIEEMEEHGHHPHEAPKIMWVPIAILVGLVCIIGLLGLVGFFVPSLSPELFIEHLLHDMLHHKVDSWEFVSGNPILKPVHTFLFNRWYMNSTYYKVFVYGLIDFAKAVFATLESKVFDKITAFVSDSTIAFGKVIHIFETKVYDPAINVGLVNVFVKGSRMLYYNLEFLMDVSLNRGVPATMTGLHNRVKKLQSGVLSYNIIYMVIIFVVLILGFGLTQMFGGI